MFNHQTLFETTQFYVQKQNLAVNPRIAALRERHDMMNSIINELNQSSKNDLKRHLLLTSDKITNIFTQLQADKENVNSINLPVQADTIDNKNGSNFKRKSDESLGLPSSINQNFNFQQPLIQNNNLRQAVFKPGADIQDLVDQNMILEQLCSNQEHFLKELFEEAENIANSNLIWKKEIIQMNNHIASIDKTISNLESNFVNEVKAIKNQVMNLHITSDQLQEEMDIECENNQNLMEQNQKYSQELSQLLEIKKQLEKEIEETEMHQKSLKEQNNQFFDFLGTSEIKQQELFKRIELTVAEKKDLNDELQSIKGNIRVYCRIRPLLPSEIHIEKCSNIIQVTSSNNVALQVPQQHLKSENNQKDYRFSFEQIFDENSSQQTVFAEMSQLIQSLIDGFNVCIFAYGQTGSGKTYTIEGGQSEESKGLMQRSMEMIFQQIKYLQQFGWTYKLFVSFQEVYMEQHRDLITNFKISEKQDQLVFVEINSIEEFYPLMKRARENRKTGSTMCNDHSSRSHSIFQLKLYGSNTKDGKTCNGTLNLVDLAGSERVTQSKAEGLLLEETKFINRSLTALGDVINSLAQKDKHTPFRNSKLTYLLQPYLSGEGSKTLMFLNLSPSSSSYHQTLCSLRFGDKVSNIKLKKK
ncbi:hypothetical protein ABPG72_007011 [Tetrahymena utriculariae]